MTEDTTPAGQALERVSAAAEALRAGKRRIRAELMAMMPPLVEDLELEVGTALAEAAAIPGVRVNDLRYAFGSKDYATIKRLINLAPAATSPEASADQHTSYSLNDEGQLVVSYENHGSKNISGYGVFGIHHLDDDAVMFGIIDSDEADPDLVRVLDGVFAGEYYDEAKTWLEQHERSNP